MYSASTLRGTSLRGNVRSLSSRVHVLGLGTTQHIPLSPVFKRDLHIWGWDLERAQPQAHWTLQSATERTARQDPLLSKGTAPWPWQTSVPAAPQAIGVRRGQPKERRTLAQLHIWPGHYAWLAPVHRGPSLPFLARR